MNLSELKDKQKNINIKVVIVKRDPEQTAKKGDKVLRVVHCYVEDEQKNKGYLSLWNEDCDKYSEGDIIEVINGYCHLYDGNPNLSAGITGMLTKAK